MSMTGGRSCSKSDSVWISERGRGGKTYSSRARLVEVELIIDLADWVFRGANRVHAGHYTAVGILKL